MFTYTHEKYILFTNGAKQAGHFKINFLRGIHHYISNAHAGMPLVIGWSILALIKKTDNREMNCGNVARDLQKLRLFTFVFHINVLKGANSKLLVLYQFG